jgi:hypothetical protein
MVELFVSTFHVNQLCNINEKPLLVSSCLTIRKKKTPKRCRISTLLTIISFIIIRACITSTPSAVIGCFIRAQLFHLLFHLERLFGIVCRWGRTWSVEIESELIPRSREAVGGLPVRPQSTRGDVLLAAVVADVRPLVVVQSLVQLEVDELREAGRAEVATVRLLTRVQSKVRLQVGRGTETLLAHFAQVGLLTCNQSERVD